MHDLFFDARARPLAGALAGLAGGLAASWAMDLFQKKVPAEAFAALLGEKAPAPQGGGSDGAPATVKTAQAISENVLDHRLTKAEKKKAGPAVHYAFGASIGSIYGLTAEYLPGTTAALGMPFGTTVWAVADEGVVPALGLGPAPTKVPRSTHLYALASHLVYGVVTEAVRRSVRAAL